MGSTRMFRRLAGLVVPALLVLLGACQAGGVQSPSAPSSVAGATSPVPAATILYLYQGRLIEQVIGGTSQRLADLPDAGAILDATVLDGRVLILREQGLQRTMLADGSTDLMVRFDGTARSGFFVPGGREMAVFQVTVDNPQAEFGLETLVGLYRPAGDSAQVVLSLPQVEQALGTTADGQSLYLLPRGQDPSFGRLLLASLETGAVGAELPIEGEVFAVLSPDGRYLATTVPQGALNLYDLVSQPLTPRVFALPQSPSHAWGLLWSPDSRFLYFLLRPGGLYDEPASSYGLWRLEVDSGAISRFAAISEPEGFLAIDHDGRWLVWGSQDGTVRVWEAQTGRQVAQMSPFRVDVKTFSPDGQWLLLRHVQEDRAALVRLPEGTPESLPLPSAATVAGWR